MSKEHLIVVPLREQKKPSKPIDLTKPFVVKVQLSLAKKSTQRVLVYNEDHSIEYMQKATKQLRKWLKGGYKNFFWAHLKNETLYIDALALWQDW